METCSWKQQEVAWLDVSAAEIDKQAIYKALWSGSFIAYNIEYALS